jgi:putative ABC transport system substrate-binding protein
MRRRETFALFVGAAATWPLAVHAQSRDRPLIAYLAAAKRSAISGVVSAFQEGLREGGDVEGRDYDIVYRFADGHDERLPGLAAELVQLKPTVIYAGAVNSAAAARSVTTTIPIVSGALADPVHLGLIASYPHPGGNVTGVAPYMEGLPAKQMELALEVVPGARKVGLLGNMNDPKAPPQREELEGVSRKLEINVIRPEVRGPEDLDAAVKTLANERAEVVIVLQTSLTLSERRKIADLAIASRLPTICGYRENVDDGGLISYGVDLRWAARRAASLVHKILNGAVPDDLPVELPTHPEMVINLKTAKAIGITISPLLAGRADEVIE